MREIMIVHQLVGATFQLKHHNENTMWHHRHLPGFASKFFGRFQSRFIIYDISYQLNLSLMISICYWASEQPTEVELLFSLASLVPRLSRNANCACVESLVYFPHKHDIIEIRLKQKGNFLHVIQPTKRSMLGVYDIQSPITRYM